jgi:DEAD/DEAH box helicase domain-containing protein
MSSPPPAKRQRVLIKRSDSDEHPPEFSVSCALTSIRTMVGYSNQLGEQDGFINVSPARSAIFRDLPEHCVDPEIFRRYSEVIGGTSLYSHQVEAVEAITAGRHVCLSTSTSSGKSLAFNLPILSALKNSNATAIYMFPSKALAQDQKRVLDAVLGQEAQEFVRIYDGDTDKLEDVRNAKLILTNPDKIHCTMLSEHSKFKNFFANLKFLVLDEAHAYDGSFGSHVACVLRRLIRTVRFCRKSIGASVAEADRSVQFVCCSATIGNSLTHARRLTGASHVADWTVVDRDGSPSGERTSVVYSPMISDEQRKSSQLEEVGAIVTRLVGVGGRVIVFCGYRAEVERLVMVLQKLMPDGAERIVGYRGGYSAEERRKLEAEIFGNRVDVVVCTNALELGIDVGSLDVCVCVGFPGSVHSLRQRFGRAGRGSRDALELLFCKIGDSIDEYLAEDRRRIFKLPLEDAVVQTDNLPIVASHLLCAWWEIKKIDFDDFDKNILFPSCEQAFDSARKVAIGLKKRPDVQIRSPIKDKVIVEWMGGTLDEYDLAVGIFFVYEGAVLVVQGHEYVIVEVARYKAFDVPNNKPDAVRKYVATAVKATSPLDYYTQYVGGSEISPQYPAIKCRRLDLNAKACVDSNAPSPTDDTALVESLGTLEYVKALIKSEITGYRKIGKKTRELIGGEEPLKPDNLTYWTRATVFCLSRSIITELKTHNLSESNSLHALGHLLLKAAQIRVLCGKGDIKISCMRSDFSLLLYDGRNGGLGVAEAVFDDFVTMLRLARDILVSCGCIAGCPRCVQHAACSQRNADKPSKEGATVLLDLALSNYDL